MAGDPIEARRFTDDEVHEILKRAVGDPETSTSSTSARDGVSLVELREISREVGIDPDRVEEAARALARGDQSSGRHPLAAAPTVLHAERVVRGDLEDIRRSEVLSVIRRAMGQHGTLSESGESVEWVSQGEGINRSLTLYGGEESVSIHASANLNGLAVLTYLPAGAVSAIVSVIGLTQLLGTGNPFGVAAFAALVPTTILALRGVLGRVSRTEKARLEQAVDDVARVALGREQAHTPTVDGPEPDAGAVDTGPEASG